MIIWKFFTSLWLTVVLLFLAIVIVFLGTLAQVNEGLYGGTARWFRSFIVWFDLFGWRPAGVSLAVPLPGGYTIGFLLLANLIAAHIKRFSWSVSKIGIQLTHLGVILLLLGQLLTDILANESHLGLREGQSKSYTEDHRANEIAVLTNRDDGQENVISIPEELVKPGGDIAVPNLPLTLRVKEYHVNGEVFSKPAMTEALSTITRALNTVQGQFSSSDLLVTMAENHKDSAGRVAIWSEAFAAVGEKNVDDIVAAAKRIQPQKEKAEKLAAELLRRFRTQMLEVMALPRPRADRNLVFAAGQIAKGRDMNPETFKEPASQGVGPGMVAFPQPEAKDGNTRNLPIAVVEVLDAGKSRGTWLLWPLLFPQEIKLSNGQEVRLALRFHRYYHPFSMKLIDAKHEIYPGTATEMNPQGIPKNFQSHVQIVNPQTGDNREVDIYMNNPLRYAGLTFFQYQMSAEEVAGREVGTSTLQVVRNPAWTTPYIGCIVVSFGMIYQFMYHLVRGGTRRRPASASAGAA